MNWRILWTSFVLVYHKNLQAILFALVDRCLFKAAQFSHCHTLTYLYNSSHKFICNYTVSLRPYLGSTITRTLGARTCYCCSYWCCCCYTSRVSGWARSPAAAWVSSSWRTPWTQCGTLGCHDAWDRRRDACLWDRSRWSRSRAPECVFPPLLHHFSALAPLCPRTIQSFGLFPRAQGKRPASRKSIFPQIAWNEWVRKARCSDWTAGSRPPVCAGCDMNR